MTTILAYTYDADTHCTICARKRFGAGPDGEVYARDNEGNEARPVFSWDDLEADYEDGMYCGTCHHCIWLPADLQALTDPEIFTPAPDQLQLCRDWHGGQSSMMYAVSSTGALTINLAPKTPRQARAMLYDLLREVETVELAGDVSAHDYIVAVEFLADIRSAIHQYS